MVNVYYQFKQQTQEGKIKVQNMLSHEVLYEYKCKGREAFEESLAVVKDSYKDANFCEMIY